MKERITIEQELLLSLIKGEDIVIPEGFSPKHCFLLLRRHKLLPLTEGLLDFIPEQNAANWKLQLKNWKLRSSLLTQELLRVNNLLQEHGIPVLNMKGPSLAIQLFGSANQRFYNDLDILIDPKHIEEAVSCLTKEAYELEQGSSLEKIKTGEHFKYNNDLVLNNQSLGIQLELHIGIYVEQLFRKEQEADFLSHQETIQINGVDLKVLSPEYYLLFLCLHGAKHMYFRLSWLRDVAEYLCKVDLDHGLLVKLAGDYRLDKILNLSLVLAKEYFAIAIPPEYDALLSKRRYPLLQKKARKIILGPGELVYEDYGRLKRKMDQITGVDEVDTSIVLTQLTFLIALRRGTFRKISFLLYQLKKRCKF